MSVRWFEGYTAEIRARIQARHMLDTVEMKIRHTMRVRGHCTDIAGGIGLSREDIDLAALIGLYHDLGRFRQALLFGTIDDRVTGSHGDMSAEIFMREAPKDGLSQEDTGVIASALRCHNLFALPAGLGARTALFAKLIRDADKLDIFHVFGDWENNKKFAYLSAEEGAYSPELVKRVLRGENLLNDTVRSKGDSKLYYISMIYDLNFAPSLKWVMGSGFLEKFTGVASGAADAEMAEIYRYVNDWMRAKAGSDFL